MNERIQELAEQAENYAYSAVVGGSECQEAFIKKFAELIILEMCNVLDKAQWDKGEDCVCADGTRIIPQVKEHFGVES